MNIFLTIIGLFGIPVIFIWTKKIIFGNNIGFIKLINSFPKISNDKLKSWVKEEIDDSGISKIIISNELNSFLKDYEKELDEFLYKLEKFNTKKIFLFHKEEIECFVNNLIRHLTNKSAELQYSIGINLKTKEIKTDQKAKSIYWTSFNYYLVYKTITEQNMDKIYIFGKKIGF